MRSAGQVFALATFCGQSFGPLGRPTRARHPADMPHPARRHRRRLRMETLSVLLGETLRPTWRNSPPCLMRLSALLASKYGGELSEVRRRVGKGRSEGCSDTVGEFGWSDEKVPDPLGTSVNRLGRLGPPTLPTARGRQLELPRSKAKISEKHS